jgi:cytochrome c peroxidase
VLPTAILSQRRARSLLLALGVASLANTACAGADASGDAITGPVVPQVPVTPTAADTAGNGAVIARLFLDPTALPNYAGQALPASYAPPVLQREDRTVGNPITDAGATLGRVLFFEKQLSRNDQLSCAGCHVQALAFGDTARFSLGFERTGRTGAHAMRLANARFNENGLQFWDRRAPSLEAQVIQPIQDATEMGFDASHGGLPAALAKVAAAPYYKRLFVLAFGDSAVTQDRVQRALAQYVRSITSTRSKWDLAVAQANAGPPFAQPLAGLTAQENQGAALFMQPPNQGGLGCAGCHTPPTFSLAGNSLSNGLDAGETRIFRSPSLKTVGMGNRYMHDGRFTTLEQVVDFYDAQVQDGPALDNRLRAPGGQPRRLNLDAAEKAALVAFLRTLSDSSVTKDPRFSDPFRP